MKKFVPLYTPETTTHDLIQINEIMKEIFSHHPKVLVRVFFSMNDDDDDAVTPDNSDTQTHTR